jgi:hypothetical protein
MADTETQAATANARFLAELDARLEQLGRRLDRLVDTLAGAQAGNEQPSPEAASADVRTEPKQHLLFLGGPSGYELLPREGGPPPLGALVQVEGRPGRYRVYKVAPSPLPGDRRPCVYLQLT